MSIPTIAVTNKQIVINPLPTSNESRPQKRILNEELPSPPGTSKHEPLGTLTIKRKKLANAITNSKLKEIPDEVPVMYRFQYKDLLDEDHVQSLELIHGKDSNTKRIRTQAKVLNHKDGKIRLNRRYTSDNFVEAIGQEQYEAVFNALLALPNEELKAQAIVALLTLNKRRRSLKSKSTQTTQPHRGKLCENRSCQTDVVAFREIEAFKVKKRGRRLLHLPYAVTDQKSPSQSSRSLLKPLELSKEKEDDVQSRFGSSVASVVNLSSLSVNSDLLKNLEDNILLANIDRVTEGTSKNEGEKTVDFNQLTATEQSQSSFVQSLNQSQTASSLPQIMSNMSYASLNSSLPQNSTQVSVIGLTVPIFSLNAVPTNQSTTSIVQSSQILNQNTESLNQTAENMNQGSWGVSQNIQNLPQGTQNLSKHLNPGNQNFTSTQDSRFSVTNMIQPHYSQANVKALAETLEQLKNIPTMVERQQTGQNMPNMTPRPQDPGQNIPNMANRPEKANLNINKMADRPQPLLPYLQTLKHPIKMSDGYDIMVPVKPEDHFHLATPENLMTLNEEDKMKLLLHQAYIDLKYALEPDIDRNLPIHQAVLANDLDWLRRQAFALKTRGETVDVLAEEGMTALQLSLYQDPLCSTTLLQLGADPFHVDSEGRAILHLAAERGADHLHDILHVCRQMARKIFAEHDELWHDQWQSRSDDDLAQELMDHMCQMVDDQGYTPLMLAAKLGNYSTGRLLIEASPRCVSRIMPTSGNTALHLAIEGACMDAGDCGNRSQLSDHFSKTIELLIKNGASLSTENYAGITCNQLVLDVCNQALNALMPAINNPRSSLMTNPISDSLILIKGQNEQWKYPRSINADKLNDKSANADQVQDKSAVGCKIEDSVVGNEFNVMGNETQDIDTVADTFQDKTGVNNDKDECTKNAKLDEANLVTVFDKNRTIDDEIPKCIIDKRYVFKEKNNKERESQIKKIVVKRLPSAQQITGALLDNKKNIKPISISKFNLYKTTLSNSKPDTNKTLKKSINDITKISATNTISAQTSTSQTPQISTEAQTLEDTQNTEINPETMKPSHNKIGIFRKSLPERPKQDTSKPAKNILCFENFKDVSNEDNVHKTSTSKDPRSLSDKKTTVNKTGLKYQTATVPKIDRKDKNTIAIKLNSKESIAFKIDPTDQRSNIVKIDSKYKKAVAFQIDPKVQRTTIIKIDPNETTAYKMDPTDKRTTITKVDQKGPRKLDPLGLKLSPHFINEVPKNIKITMKDQQKNVASVSGADVTNNDDTPKIIILGNKRLTKFNEFINPKQARTSE